MSIELLEQRRMLALNVSGGLLTVNGTTGVDQYEITQVVNGATTTTIVSNLIAKTSESTTSAVTSITVNLLGGDDYIRLGTLQNTNQVGASVPAKIFGGSGNDWIIGGRGNDSLVGEAGNDRLEGKAGSDTLDGGTGLDTADYSSRGDPLSFFLADALSNDGGTDPVIFAATGGVEGDRVLCENVLSGGGNDKLFGDNNANLLDGGAGVDSVVGNGGNDTVIGGVTSDTVLGGNDNDYLSIKDGALDTASGESGNDTGRIDQVAAGDPVTDVPAALESSQLVAGPSSLSAGGSSLHLTSSGPSLGGGSSFLLPGQFPSDLDPSFGNESGKVTVNIPTALGNVSITDIATQVVFGAYKTVAVGYGYGESSTDFAVIRFDEDGSLDTSFGDPDGADGFLGYTFTNFFSDSDFGESDDYAQSVTIDSTDNSIVVGGYTRQYGLDGSESFSTNEDFAIARYATDGTLDPSFGSGGMQTHDFGNGFGYGYGYGVADDEAFSVAIVYHSVESRSYILGGDSFDRGFGDGDGDSDIRVVQFDSSGAADNSYGTDFNDYASGDAFDAMAVNPDDHSVWVVGHTDEDGELALVFQHYAENGSRIADDFFDSTLVADVQAHAIVVDTANDQFLIAGERSFGAQTSTQGIIWAFDYENSVSGELVNYGSFEDEQRTYFYDIALDSANTAVAVGETPNQSEFSGGDADFIVARVFTDGVVPDDGFAPDESSFTQTNFVDYGEGNSYDQAFAVTILPDGRILAGGYSDGSIALARYVGGSSEPEQIVEDILDDSVNSDDELNLYKFTYSPSEVSEPDTEIPLDDDKMTLPDYLIQRLRPNLTAEGVLTLPTASDRDDLILVDQFIDADGNAIVRVNISFDTTTYRRSDLTRVVIDGGGGNDTFIVDPSVTVPVSLIGGVGNDIIQAGVNNDTVNAGAGLDIVIGGPGADTLLGEGDRDIIIGGLGADIINGGADDDILINGTTSYDNNFPALAGIMSEWGTTARNYATRIANINGTGRGTKNNGSFLFKTGTVFSDTSVDNLIGGVGGAPSNSDWFLAKMFGTDRDVLADASGEVITSI